MRQRYTALLGCLVATLCTSACNASLPTTAHLTTTPAAKIASASSGSMGGMSMAPLKSIVAGTVLAPASIVSSNSGNLISDKAAGIIASNSGSLTGSQSDMGGMKMFRSVLSVETSPLAGAQVYLADAAGNPIPGMPTATTDEHGKYTLRDVPSGTTFVVVVKRKLDASSKKELFFQTLTRSTNLGTTADVDAASTLATAGVLQSATSDLGDYKPATFQHATDVVRGKLSDKDLPDFTDRSAIIAKVNQLASEVAELKSAMDEIQSDLTQIKMDHETYRKEIDELKQEVEILKKKVDGA